MPTATFGGRFLHEDIFAMAAAPDNKKVNTPPPAKAAPAKTKKAPKR